MSTYDDNDLGALNRLEDLLDAYCQARLAPPGSVMPRIRANVLAEARAASAAALVANRPRLMEPPAAFNRPAVPPRFARAVFALGFAAMLTLGTSLAVFAAPPGSPFYNASLFVETLALPAQAEARFEGHEKLLDERLDEAELAAANGDTIGLAAALAAYQDEVDAATADAGSDPDRLAHLEAMLAKHTSVLTALAARLPAQSSIENAIDASSKAITKLQERTHPSRPTHQPQNGGQSGGQGGQGAGSDEDGQGAGANEDGQGANGGDRQ